MEAGNSSEILPISSLIEIEEVIYMMREKIATASSPDDVEAVISSLEEEERTEAAVTSPDEEKTKATVTSPDEEKIEATVTSPDEEKMKAAVTSPDEEKI